MRCYEAIPKGHGLSVDHDLAEDDGEELAPSLRHARGLDVDEPSRPHFGTLEVEARIEQRIPLARDGGALGLRAQRRRQVVTMVTRTSHVHRHHVEVVHVVCIRGHAVCKRGGQC